MTLSIEDQERIIEQESAWVDADFGQLDLQSFPHLRPQPPENDRHDDRFAKSWEDSPFARSSSALKQFLQNPDDEALARVGHEIGDVSLVEEVRERKQEQVAEAFLKQRPQWQRSDHNLAALVECLYRSAFGRECNDADQAVDQLYDAGIWSPENLVSAFDALSKAGELQTAPGEVRNLTQSERLQVMRLAQSGRQHEAIEQFLRYALGEDECRRGWRVRLCSLRRRWRGTWCGRKLA